MPTDNNTKRTFDQTRRLAKRLGDKIRIIEDKMPWSRDLTGKGKQLLAVHEAMTLIGETPNASINEAGLKAFDRHVEEALEGIRAWAKELFTPEEPDSDLLDDEIAF